FTACSNKNSKESSSSDLAYNPIEQFDYPSYNSLEEIKNASNLIVKGSILSDDGRKLIKLTPGEENETEMDYNLYTIKIDEILETKGYNGETVQIKIPYSQDSPETFTTGTEGIFFLETYEGFPASLLNLDQAYLEIEDYKVILNEDTEDLIPETKDDEVPVEEIIDEISN
ncbi:hypothetical protein LJC13_04480, partial [Peptostreptococcaceae bacterium OttesenSCG-928-C18]|nr:hypothetical protein [Peptostreptococcaceae bacterium OttesenSCG-928-C18]